MDHAGENAVFRALADPTRRELLSLLREREQPVAELTRHFAISQPAISQHLKVLEDAGLVVRRVEGTRRPRRLSKAGVDAMDEWLAMLRQALEANYERLDGVLATIGQREPTKKGRRR